MTATVSVFNEKYYPVTVQAVGSSEVVGWDRKTMLEFMATHPRLAINMLRVTVERLDDIQNRYLELCVEQVEQRVARALLRIMKQSGRKIKEGILIDFRFSRQDLSGRLHRHYPIHRESYPQQLGKKRVGLDRVANGL